MKSEEDSLEILNSFFIRDLEKSINYLKNNDHPVLESYVNGVPVKEDLLAVEQYPLLLDLSKPQLINRGHWPFAPSNKMSLMQQCLINQRLKSLPILATNGPPGTGKTTLLKDLVADIFVQRAQILSKFTSVYACFQEKRVIGLDGTQVSIQILKPELTGFEILVVSSNNTAVENISKELPLKSALDKIYQKQCSYLQPVAAKLAATHHQGQVIPLAERQKPWGLFAAALGKSTNKKEFVERVFFSTDDRHHTETRKNKGEYLSIWEWRDQYKGLSFAEARTAFQKASAAVDNYTVSLVIV